MMSGESYQVVGTASLAELEAAQVVVSAPPGAAPLHYITDSTHPADAAATQWFVVEECSQVLTPAESDSAGRLQPPLATPSSGGERCLVCRAALAAGWPVQTCVTKHGRIGYLTLLLDILVPDGEVAR
ncbi:hypothetical protein FJT64_005327 [Amphibalanus amphitrite]|uniref:Uncharacterized protein n=1 Tax=Amphibalanus amphitrite TaxID=1232801 RepID=A0A6A4W5S6_AMPAM|nr:hypothetical protein FJT64_005327 [Amphibalanus amphitrite]